ncbi:MAG: PhoH family protein, partial [Gemmatimonadota bacterium]
MADESQHRISTEGADPLLLAGVNDSNLVELQRTLGVKVSLRGDTLTLGGTTEQIERATPVVQGLIDLARMGESISPEDIIRFAAEGQSVEAVAGGDQKIVLPGLRRVIAPKTAGQRDYLQAISE